MPQGRSANAEKVLGAGNKYMTQCLLDAATERQRGIYSVESGARLVLTAERSSSYEEKS